MERGLVRVWGWGGEMERERVELMDRKYRAAAPHIEEEINVSG
jgi:hypothetical protein